MHLRIAVQPGNVPHGDTPAAGGSDSALVGRVRSGEVAAFEIMFRRHYDGLIAFARMLGLSLGEAEDVVQDVLGRVWTGRERWEVQTTVAAYLYGGVRNRAIGLSQRTRVAQQWAGGEQQAQADMPRTGDTDEQLEERELVAMVRQTIAGLPERCRTTYLMSREQGLTYPEIASAMGVSVKTVNHQMTRAMSALRDAVRRWNGQ